MKKIGNLLDKFHAPNWLVILFAIVIILRIPSFFEPYSYGDEMIYLTLGEAIRQGMTLYRDIHDNKPPLLYILAGIAGNVFWFRVILAFWNLGSIFIFWKLAQVILPKREKVQKLATIIFAVLTTIPLLEGQIANAEVFMIGPTLLAFLILFTKKLDFKNLFFAGLLFSSATLFKVPAAFDVGVILTFWFIYLKAKGEDLKGFIRKSSFLFAGFLSPIVASLLWYYLKGALPQYLSAAFLQNIGYLSSWRPAVVSQPFLVKNGPLLIRGGIVALGTLILYLKRAKLSKTFVLLTLWILFSLFATTLSERPYPHYMIQAVPALSFLLALLLADRTLEQVLVIIPLTLAFIVPVYYKFYYYPTASYYGRFLELAVGKISREEYFARFDGNVNRNYKLADVVLSSTAKGDKIFVWGDSPPIYALTRRFPPMKFVATYHINDFFSKSETIEILEENNPTLIIILPDAPEFKELVLLTRKNYILIDEIDGAQVYYLTNPEVRAFLAR